MISFESFVMLFVQTFLLDKSKQSTTFSIMNTHAYFNRQTIIDAYIDRILDEMDIKDLKRIAGDYLEENKNFSEYTDEQLISEIQDHYPELFQQLKDIQLSLNNKLNTYEKQTLTAKENKL